MNDLIGKYKDYIFLLDADIEEIENINDLDCLIKKMKLKVKREEYKLFIAELTDLKNLEGE